MTIGGIDNVPGAGGNLAPYANLAGNPFGQEFVIPQRGIRGMSPAQLEELKQWDPGSSQQLQNIYDNRKLGGPQLPLAYSNGSMPMGNAGAVNEILANTQGVPWAPRTTLPAPGWNPGMLPDGSNFRPSPQWEQRGGPSQNQRTDWQAAGFQNKMIS